MDVSKDSSAEPEPEPVMQLHRMTSLDDVLGDVSSVNIEHVTEEALDAQHGLQHSPHTLGKGKPRVMARHATAAAPSSKESNLALHRPASMLLHTAGSFSQFARASSKKNVVAEKTGGGSSSSSVAAVERSSATTRKNEPEDPEDEEVLSLHRLDSLDEMVSPAAGTAPQRKDNTTAVLSTTNDNYDHDDKSDEPVVSIGDLKRVNSESWAL